MIVVSALLFVVGTGLFAAGVVALCRARAVVTPVPQKRRRKLRVRRTNAVRIDRAQMRRLHRVLARQEKQQRPDELRN
jgi:hypothetical protein